MYYHVREPNIAIEIEMLAYVFRKKKDIHKISWSNMWGLEKFGALNLTTIPLVSIDSHWLAANWLAALSTQPTWSRQNLGFIGKYWEAGKWWLDWKQGTWSDTARLVPACMQFKMKVGNSVFTKWNTPTMNKPDGSLKVSTFVILAGTEAWTLTLHSWINTHSLATK